MCACSWPHFFIRRLKIKHKTPLGIYVYSWKRHHRKQKYLIECRQICTVVNYFFMDNSILRIFRLIFTGLMQLSWFFSVDFFLLEWGIEGSNNFFKRLEKEVNMSSSQKNTTSVFCNNNSCWMAEVTSFSLETVQNFSVTGFL